MKSSTRGLTLLLAISAIAFVAACATPNVAHQDDNRTVATPPSPSDVDHNPAPLPDGPEVLEGFDPAGVPGPTSAAPTDGVSVNRAQLNDFLGKGPQYPLTLVQVRPAFDAGQFRGFEVVALSERGLSVLGDALRPGDVILKVNERSIGRPESYMAAWESLKDCETIAVEILRDGQNVKRAWQVRAPAAKAQMPSQTRHPSDG